MLVDEKHVVSVWLATKVSHVQLAEYLEEHYGDNDDSINRFAADAGDSFYDHDFVEFNRSKSKPKSVLKLVAAHSYAESFATSVARKAEQLGIKTATNSVVLYDVRLEPAEWPEESPLTFIGTFAYTIPYPTPDVRSDDHHSKINTCFISSNGKYGITTSWDAELRLWDLQSGTLIDSQKHPGTILEDFNNRVVITGTPSSGKYILSYRSEFAMWQPTKRELKLCGTVPSPHKAGISQLLFRSNRSCLFTASFDRTILQWKFDLNSPTKRRFDGHAGRVYGLGLLPGGRLLSVDDEGAFRIWDTRRAATERSLSIPRSTPIDLYVTRDGKAAIVCSFSDRLLIVDLNRSQLIRDLFEGYSGSLHRMIVTPDEKHVIAACRDGATTKILIWNRKSCDVIQSLSGHSGEITGLVLSHDAKILVSSSYDANLIFWDWRKGKEVARYREAPDDRETPEVFNSDGYTLRSIACSTKDNTILVGEESGRARIIRFDQNQLTLIR